jgi:hypothetical protein
MRNILKAILAVCVSFAISAPPLVADELVIGKDAPEWKIFHGADAPPSVKLAAKELSEYLRRVTGATAPVTTSLDGLTSQTIYLGDTAFAKDHKVDVANLKNDSFRILTTSNGIIIAGHDYAGQVMSSRDNPYRLIDTYNSKQQISAFGDAGTLQGVYYFLRTYFGVRWYMPGELGEVVPSLPQVVLPAIDLEKSPVYSYRYPYFCHFENADKEALWYRRAGFGAPFPVVIMHSFNQFLKYKDTNPEFFAVIGGKPDFTNLSTVEGSGNLNLSEPGLLKAVVADISEYFDQNPSSMLFPLAPPDGMWQISEDPVSQAQIDLSMGGAGKFSDYVWGFVNKVAAEVRKTHPDKFIGCIAYEHYTKPPKQIAKLEPNVVVMICKQRRKFPDEEYEKMVRQSIDEWHEKAANIYTWEYFCDILFNSGWKGYPVFYPASIQRDLQLLRGKVKGEMIESESWGTGDFGNPEKTVMNFPGMQHPQLYVASQLLWDPDTDLAALLDEYYKKFYGPAEKPMRQFWGDLETAWMKKIGLNPGDVYSKKDTEKLLGYLNAGIEATEPDSPFRKRIEMIKTEFAPAALKAARLAAMVKPEATITKASKDEPATAVLAGSIWENDIPIMSLIDTAYSKAKPPTHVRLAWTPKALKVSMVCFEPKMDQTTGAKMERDSSIWTDDSVEIFLRPNSSKPDAYHFIVNVAGSVYDAKNTSDSWHKSDKSWNSSAEVAVKREKNQWIAELSIPWSDLGVSAPKAGDVLTGNFCRSRNAGGERQEFSWSPIVKGNFFEPDDFGRMVLGN